MMLLPTTETACASTLEVAKLYEEKANAAMILGELAGPITLSPASCRDLALLLRSHAQMLLAMQAAFRTEQERADASRQQTVRALVVIEQVKNFGFMEMVAFWRSMRSGD